MQFLLYRNFFDGSMKTLSCINGKLSEVYVILCPYCGEGKKYMNEYDFFFFFVMIEVELIITTYLN